MSKEVLIIIPAFNEEDSISALLEQLSDSKEICDIADVLVINDGSKDGTSAIAKGYSNVTVISHVYNLGYGAALQTGYKYAVRKGYQYVIQIDADGQHDICNVLNIYEKLTADSESRPDIVIGSRFAEGGKSFYISPIKKISISFFRKIILKLTGHEILDPTSGLQGLNKEAFLYYSRFGNFDIQFPDANMIIQMLMEGFRVIEIPSVMHERVAGESMHSGIIKPIIYMMTMPLSILNVYYQQKKRK